MKTKSLAMALAACLFFLSLCLSPAARAARIDVVVEHGVKKEAETQARMALDTALNFFQNTYGLGLQRNLQVILVPDKMGYTRALKQSYGLSEGDALKLANKTAGFSRGSAGATIIVNMGSLHNNLARLFCLCHELVHQFQSQESRDKHAAIRWVSEGAADAIAAHILETAGVRGAASIKKYWLENLRKARSLPRLEKLHTYQDWFAAMDAHGSVVTYGTAATAVLLLVQWKGYRPLFAYFSALRQGVSPEEAFYRAFGARVGDFEKQFHPV